MTELSSDPYGGARRAYLALNPAATDDEWENWVSKNVSSSDAGFDDFGVLARLCREVLSRGLKIDDAVAQHVGYALGYFEAMDRTMKTLQRSQPISALVPQHAARHAAGVVNPKAQFE